MTTGLAEPIRWALEIGGKEWEDVRLSREDFAAVKPSKLCLQISYTSNVAVLVGGGAYDFAHLQVGKKQLPAMYPALLLILLYCTTTLLCVLHTRTAPKDI